MSISLIGIILKGRYCIVERLGQGGQGSLYLAQDLDLGILWAVKEIPLEKKREAKLLRLLEHPSLPKMIDYAEREEFCYLVMEYIRGKSLGEWLRDGRVFTFEEILRIGMETAEILKYLHAQKPTVIYGDLKPDNLMLTESGRLYLVDFGSAVLGYADWQNMCQGTVNYAAPEQFEGRVTTVSDVYALGKTLSVLCGKKRKWYLIKNPGFGVLLRRCCRREENMRYKDMSAVQKQIESVQKHNSHAGIKGVLYMALAVTFIALAGVLWAGFSGQEPFEEALSNVTEKYYEDAFLYGNTEEKQDICRAVEKELQGLLKDYRRKEEQRKILLLLALNGELQGEEEHAAVYYEQLLLYDPKYEEAYGQYGLFLCRQGLPEESRRLWERYCSAKKAENMENTDEKLMKIWEERRSKNDDEDNEEEENKVEDRADAEETGDHKSGGRKKGKA